jgi:hypothetical protein
VTSALDTSSFRLWYGVIGAPTAWVLFVIGGVGSSQAACSVAGASWSVSNDAWAITLTLTAGAVAVGAELAALATYRATRHPGNEPPASRVHFLSVIGILVSGLFLVLIVLAGVGAFFQPECVQS